ncbi:MAG: hypothetical protein RR929_01090 [Erysipelotrichaceae bacterium]
MFDFELKKARQAIYKAYMENDKMNDLDAEKILEELLLADIELDALNKALKRGESFMTHSKIVEKTISELAKTIDKLIKPTFNSNLDKEFGTDVGSFLSTLDKNNDMISYIHKDKELDMPKGKSTYGEVVANLDSEYKKFYKLYKAALGPFNPETDRI